MYINQISVFIENKPGNLAKFTRFIAENHINMRAFEIADTSDFGIIRIVVDKPLDTLTLLKDHDWICQLTQVIGVKIPDQPGSMAKVMDILAAAEVSIEYVYTSLAGGSDDAIMIFRVQDNDKVAAVLKKSNVTLVSQEDLVKM